MLTTILRLFHSRQAGIDPSVGTSGPSALEDRGYYQAQTGEILNSRYEISRQIGQGRQSSVWLTKDLKSKELRAIKILCDFATTHPGQPSELDILQHIRRESGKASRQGWSNVLQLSDHFTMASSRGQHLCLLMDPLGESLQKLQGRFKARKMPSLLVRQIARQLLEALAFLHEDCQIVHTDLKQDNVLEDRASAGQFSVKVKLIDFGTAAFRNGHHSRDIQPVQLRAPEVILGCEWNANADIWNYGCLVFELLTGAILFPAREGPNYTGLSFMIGCMTVIVEEVFPSWMVQSGCLSQNYIGTDGNTLLQVEQVPSLKKALTNYDVLSDEELVDCVSFLHSALRLDPTKRSTAEELLKHKWLKVGDDRLPSSILPAIEGNPESLL